MTLIKQNKGRWSIDVSDLTLQDKQNYRQQYLPDNLGDGDSKFFKLGQDLNFIETHYSPNKDFSLLSQVDSAEPRLVVTLGLKGSSRFLGKKGDEVIFNKGFTTITSFNSSLGDRQYEANKELLQLRFSLSKNFFRLYFGEQHLSQIFTAKNLQNLSFRPITASGLVAAQQLLSNKTADDANLLFMHGQALSLLAAELSHLFVNNKGDTNKFNTHDKKIANTARDILFSEFKIPPSVDELAKRVGTNQFKLKKIFHHFFNTTPYGLLLEIRMNKAYELLKNTQCHVNIAADFVGYRHASNFSAAFIKYFGVSPKHIAG